MIIWENVWKVNIFILNFVKIIIYNIQYNRLNKNIYINLNDFVYKIILKTHWNNWIINNLLWDFFT